MSDRTVAAWKEKEAVRDAEKAARAKKAKAAAKKASDPTVGNKRTGGGTIIGGSNDVKARVAAGLNPVAGLECPPKKRWKWRQLRCNRDCFSTV